MKAELDEAVRAAIACMGVDTRDDILDVNVGANTVGFADNLASADYKLYSQAEQSQKQCLTEHG